MTRLCAGYRVSERSQPWNFPSGSSQMVEEKTQTPKLPALCDHDWGRGWDPRCARLETRDRVGKLKDEMLPDIVSRF